MRSLRRGMRWTGWMCAAQCLCGAGAPPAEPEPDALTLRFAEPMTSVIDAGHPDETQQQRFEGKDAETLFFDAAHRFLLLRFPDSAAAVHRKMEEGYEVEGAHLELRREGSPWPQAPGYPVRVWLLPQKGDTPEPPWRVGVWALRRPWIRDAELGPTWNAYLNGVGWWGLCGARGATDRAADMLDESEVSKERPQGRWDVTRVFNSARFGTDGGRRLRAMEDHGFLIQRSELSHYAFGHGALGTGVVPLYVSDPVLTVRLRRAASAQTMAPLPPARDGRALAERLAAAGGDGVPDGRVPANLDEVVRDWRACRLGDMPDWMRARVQEVWDLPHYIRGNAEQLDSDPLTILLKALDSGDTERYAGTVLRWELSRPPGWEMGHNNIHYILPLLAFADLLPEVVRYNCALHFRARWSPPWKPDQVTIHRMTGTLNHMAQRRPKAMLGAEVTGLHEVADEAHYQMSLLNRMMIYRDGFDAEMGDSYYRGITLRGLQTAARFSREPLLRLKAGLMVEKLLFTDMSTYHPGLRHRVSRASRRYRGLHEYVLGQNLPEAALHMLSRSGALIETDRLADGPTVHGMNIVDLQPVPPVEAALLAPWGAEWECHAVDDKPLPFRSVFTSNFRYDVQDGLRGRRQTATHAMTYMGRHYALASEEVYTGASIPALAAWRRSPRTVERVEDFGVLFLQGRLNDRSPGLANLAPFGMLQHDNKLVWAVNMIEREVVAPTPGRLERQRFDVPGHHLCASVREEGVKSFSAQVSLMAYGPQSGRVVHVNGRELETFPAAARQGDVITIGDGVSYIGLIPLPATDMGRREDVVIRDEYPFLLFDAYVLDRERAIGGDDDGSWARLATATAGWVVEFGDESEHGSFAAFDEHMRRSRVEHRWEADESTLHLSYEALAKPPATLRLTACVAGRFVR